MSRPQAHALPLLGFGLYLAWSSLVVPFEQGLGVERFSSALARFYIISALTAATLLVLAFLARSGGRHLWWPALAAACAVLATFGSALDLVAVAAPAHGLALDVCAIVFRSVADAWLFIMWNRAIAGQCARVAWTGYTASMVLASCFYFVFTALGTVGAAVGMLCLPALTCLLLGRSMRLGRDGAPDDPGLSWSFPWRPVILMALFSFAFSLVIHYDVATQPLNELGRLAVALAVLAGVVFAFDRMDVGLLYKVAPALMVTGLLLSSSGEAPQASSLLAGLGYYGFTLFAYMMLSEISYRFGASSEWLFGVTQSVCLVCTIPGSALGHALLVDAALPAGWTPQIVFGSAVVALALFGMLLMTERVSVSTWGVRARRNSSASSVGDDGADGRSPLPDGGGEGGWSAGVTGLGYAEERIARCALVARRYGLTHREEEVLSLVAQGLTFQQVEADLCIAHGTLRVHVQHIYAKMDVHSYDEMRAAVERFTRA